MPLSRHERDAIYHQINGLRVDRDYWHRQKDSLSAQIGNLKNIIQYTTGGDRSTRDYRQGLRNQLNGLYGELNTARQKLDSIRSDLDRLYKQLKS